MATGGEQPFSGSVSQEQPHQPQQTDYSTQYFMPQEALSVNSNECSVLSTGGISLNTEKQRKCTMCSYKTANLTHMKEHVLSHTEERDYACHFCPHRSTSKSNLQQHLRIHTGEKPFVCNYCPHRCSRKNNLQKHMLIHSGVKPFKCHYCDHRTNREDRLQFHIAKNHPTANSKRL